METVGFDRVGTKAAAKKAIRANGKSVYITALVWVVFSFLISYLYSHIVYANVDVSAYLQALTSGDLERAYTILFNGRPTTVGYLLLVSLRAMTGMLNVGLTIACIRIWRHRKCAPANIFDGFSHFFRIIWLEICTTFFIYLWSLLFIIPGIIAAYRYRMALYLLLDNPEMRPMDCIRESKRMMTGHKTDAFVLDWSFFGYYLIIYAVTQITSSLPLLLAYLIQGAVNIYLYPYFYTSYVGFYTYITSLEPHYDPKGPGTEDEQAGDIL